jgi:2-hydroxy-6-oxonona-2,4-dienedioate hydrolase
MDRTRLTERLESRWTEVRGLSMHARVAADLAAPDPPEVVLVHGVGVSSRYMIPTAERLAPFCRVYVPDLPGFGKSAKPSRVLTLTELADALLAWIEASGLQRVALVGNSFGCQIIVDLAVRHPDRIERIVLQGPTIDPRARTWLRQIWRWLVNTPGEASSQGGVILRDYRDCGIPRLLRTFQEALRDRIEEKLPRVQVPALVVRGSRDAIVPQRWAEEATRLLPMGRLVVIPGAAHTLNYNSPVELVRVITPFLTDSQPGPAMKRDA